MSTKDNEVNRRIDGETAEGHRIRLVGEAEDAGKREAKREASIDDEAEGHKVRLLGEAEDADKNAARRNASLDDEAEGHRVRI